MREYDYRDIYGDDADEESCGHKCRGHRRHRYCRDGMCGGGDCSTCYGEGVDHDHCPEPEPECAECGDSGDVECDHCLGAQRVYDDDGAEVECPQCEGSGAMTCPECGGEG